MNSYYKYAAGVALVFLMGGTAFAAGNVVLNNGPFSLGSGSSFGYSVCDRGTAPFSGSVPVLISANGVSQTVSFSSPLAAGACGTSYLPYATFNMNAGKSYTIKATIDPAFSVVSNTDNLVSYGTIAVPATAGGQVLGATTISASEVNFLLNELMAAETELYAMLSQIEK